MKAREIAEFVNGELRGTEDPSIDSIADFNSAVIGNIAFLSKPSDSRTKASCVIISPLIDAAEFSSCIIVDDPKLAFARIAAVLHPPKSDPAGISGLSVVAESATLDDTVFIGAFVAIGAFSIIGKGSRIESGAKIGERVTVGDNCIIHSNVVIEDGCVIGNNVVVHSGTVIGSDGFGYVPDADGNHVKFPQIGSVVIEDDVEIGANTCIDRGALGETRIGAGTKIDNLVQIAHNVHIGKQCIIAAQTGISGSSVIEDNVVIAGQVGIADHVRIRSGAVIGAQAGVPTGKIIRKGVWWGTPARPLDEFKTQYAMLNGIGRLRDQVRDLAKSIEKDRS